MIRKRSSFWTVLFSFFPGAGHMFMGFLKQGLSLMLVALVLMFLAVSFHLGELITFMPLVWFYSFFDALNKSSLPDEDFYTLEDNFMFSLDKLAQADWSIIRKQQAFLGWLAVLLGGSMLFNNLLYLIRDYFPSFYEVARRLGYRAPQLIIGLFIIVLGIRLIAGKRKETIALPDTLQEVETNE